MGIFDKNWQKNAKQSLIKVKRIVPGLYQFATNKVGEYTNPDIQREKRAQQRQMNGQLILKLIMTQQISQE